MHSLIETYDEVYKKIKQFKDQIADYENQIQQINTRRDDEIPARIANLTAQLKKIDEYQLKIDGFMKLAEKHMTSKNVLTIEAPPGYRVNLNRLRTWSMMIDPMSDDDPYAQRVYLVSKCDLCFLEKKEEEFAARIVELDNDLANGSVEEIKDLENHIKELKASMAEYVSGEEMATFAERVREENEGYMYLDAPGSFKEAKELPAYWMPGAYGVSLEVEEDQRRKLKGLMGMFYDEKGGRVYLPIEKISTENEFAMTISCVPARRRLNEMDAGIRNLIFNVIDKSPVGSRKVYVVDAVRQNSALVGSLKQIEGTFGLQPVPRNAEQIQSTLEELLSSFNDIDEVLENYDTVAEYNKAVSKEKQIPRSVVVLVGWPNAFEGTSNDYIKKIITNYERYGISFVMVKISAKTDKEEDFGLSEYVGENIVHISMTSKETNITFGSENPHRFSWYPFKHNLSDDYVEEIKSRNIAEERLGTEYIKRIDMENIPPYVRGNKKLELPYGVDAKDQVHNISFENENFAAYLMGASGSGKSTLLHTIITGILRNYHPDDVELWLADFKMSEFAQYIEPLPPHIKYILLDESPELVYDLLDRLTEKMMERQRFFMKHKDMKKVENVPKNIYMPVIFVILDEFSIMSQAVSESEVYKLRLQNLLAKGRALGIKFIFASQTFTKGIAGLTQTAKDQIQTRIAMKNSYNEINETLEVSASQRNEQVKNWMEALPPHFALSKYREKDNVHIKRLQVMYFKGKGDEALAPQRNLINRLNSTMRPVDVSEYDATDVNKYVDKQAVIVDGNSYKAFNIEKATAILENYRQLREADISSDDVLITLGTPRRMLSAEIATISNESRENILLIARAAEQACGMSLLMTTMRLFEQQGATVRIWAYNRSRLYKAYRDSHFCEYSVADGMDEICTEIADIKEKIQNKEYGKDLIVLIGMEQICSDFELIDFHTGSSFAVPKQSPINLEELAVQSEEEREALKQVKDIQLATQEIVDRIEEEGIEQGKSPEEIMQEIDDAIEAYMREHGTEFAEKSEESIQEDVEDSEAEEDVTEEVSTESTQGAYNAMEDFKYIVKQGSRFGYHFILCLNNYSDIKNTQLQQELFRHKLLFQVSADDSVGLIASRAASKLPEHICLYSNTLEQYSLRPFIHKGINWDGWDIDESGEATNMINI